MVNQTAKITEEFKLVDSLEILLQDTSDNSASKVKWSLIESNTDYTVIKIDFEDPDFIAPKNEELSISVTFWGVDYFKSSKGKAVRFGTELNWNVYR